MLSGNQAVVYEGLIYLLEDCFERLRDIRLIEESKADAAAWATLPAQCVLAIT